MLKISSQYLERFQIYGHLTEKFWQMPAYVCKNWPISYKRRQAIAKIFQLNGNNSKTAQDIDLNFSAFVYYMYGLNWHKNFSHCSISESAAPSSMQKLWTPIATIFVEKKFWKEFWWGSRPIKLPHERNFWFLEKNGVLEFLEQVRSPESVVHA